MPLPIGFFAFVDKFDNEINVALHMNSKCGVWPFITQPKAMNPSKCFKFFDITTGISKVPGTLMILISFLVLLNFFKEPFIKFFVMSS